MATKRKGGARRKPATRARKSTAIARRKSNPIRRTKRRSPLMARTKRRSYGRRRNPSGKLLPLVIGAGISQIGASLIPFGGGPFIEAAKVAGVGWLLERFLGRTVPSVFGEAKEGGMIAGGVLLFNAYLAPTLAGAVHSVMPSPAAKSNGVSGIALASYPFVPGGQLMPPSVAAQAKTQQTAGMRGMATAGYPMR